MQEVLATVLSFPTIVFTALLGLALLYWLVVIFGALDLDFLDGALGLDGMDAALDGAFDTIDGAAEGALDGALESLDGVTEAAAEAAEAVDAKAGALSGFLNAMGVRGIPITIVGSFALLWAWLLSYVGTRLLGSLAASALVGLFVASVSLLGAVVFGTLSSRPFKKIFATHEGPRRASLVGKMCTVTSSRVDARSGQAEIEDGGSGFIAEVRCPQDNALKRGEKALVYRYDDAEGIFYIGPVDEVLAKASRI